MPGRGEREHSFAPSRALFSQIQYQGFASLIPGYYLALLCGFEGTDLNERCRGLAVHNASYFPALSCVHGVGGTGEKYGLD
jgi:hypothetical protein